MFRQIKIFGAYLYRHISKQKCQARKEIFSGMAFYHLEFKKKNIFTYLTIKICP